MLYLPEAIVSVFVIMFCLIGAYSEHNNLTDLWMIVVFGIVGYLFERYRFPIAPMVLGTILGPVAETAFQTSMISYGNDWTVFFTRPVSGVGDGAVRHRAAVSVLRRRAQAQARPRGPGEAMSATVVERLDCTGSKFRSPSPYKLSFGPVTKFDTILVEAQDSDGRIGLGEATLLTGYTDETVDGAWDLMQRVAAGFPGLAPQRCLEQTVGLAQDAPFAATGLATAMEMLQASPWLRVDEATRVPLLGLVNGDDPDELEAEVTRLLAEGFGTLKIKVGFDADEDARRVKRIQKAVAGRCRLRIDANQGYDREQGCAFAAALDPEGIELFEQPCAAGDWDAARAVADVSPVPMMLDESIYGMDDIERAAQAEGGALHQAQADEDGQPRGAGARALRRIRELGHGAGARQRRRLRSRVLDGGLRRAHADRQRRRDERLPEARHAPPRQSAAVSRTAHCCSTPAMRRGSMRMRCRAARWPRAAFH